MSDQFIFKYMKHLILIFGFVFVFIESNAQFSLNLNGVESKSGKKIVLKDISSETNTQGTFWSVHIEINGSIKDYNVNELKKFSFNVSNLKEFWQNQAIKNKVYVKILIKYGPQYDLREEWEEETLQYLNELEQKKLIFNDSYLESYLYSIVYKIFPGSINDGRPGIVNVKVMIDNYPNAFTFTNGTIIITTGLLSTINSEEELIGVMSHEIAHFVLDHSTININKATQRQKNAEFWTAFTTTLAAATEIYASFKINYFNPGALTFDTAVWSSEIDFRFYRTARTSIHTRTRAEADKCAVELMKFIKIDPTALSSALSKISDYSNLYGNYLPCVEQVTSKYSRPDKCYRNP